MKADIDRAYHAVWMRTGHRLPPARFARAVETAARSTGFLDELARLLKTTITTGDRSPEEDP